MATDIFNCIINLQMSSEIYNSIDAEYLFTFYDDAQNISLLGTNATVIFFFRVNMK